MQRYVYSPYGVPTIYHATWANVRSASSYATSYTITGRQLDTKTELCYYRARCLSAQLGRFSSRDPSEYEAGDSNLYRYAFSNPTVSLDPLGRSVTGPCNIWIYAGHGIWPWGQVDPAARDFGRTHDKPTDIVTGCGNYLAYVGCEGADLNARVTDGRRIPGYPGINGPAAAANMLGEVQKALEAARALQKELRDNRKKFCDDGTPERYDRTCKNMQRCDSVTIHVSCDADMKFLMETGWYRQRPWPGGPVIPPNSRIFQPTKESQSICGLSEELDCTK